MHNHTEIISPLASGGKAVLIKNIDVEKLITTYKTSLNIDPSKYFSGLKFISIYECDESGYKFFYPVDNSIMGDSEFYELLEKQEWYYMPWKWEHGIFLKEVNKNDRILEVGSGGLGFIEKLNKDGYNIIGLELNKRSIEKSIELGLNVKPFFIEDFAEENPSKFDVVCSFQVLEHISNVKSFLNASIKALRKGGKLIICVPNNDSFIKMDESLLMNYPPHHAGWWDTKSLKNLVNHFPLKLKSIKYEPLQYYHVDWFVNIQMQYGIGSKCPFGKGLFRSVYKHCVNLVKNQIKGHSIFVVYEKL